MLVQFGNNWIQKIPLTAKLDSAYGLVQFWLSSEFFSSNYFQIGQHVVLLHILIDAQNFKFMSASYTNIIYYQTSLGLMLLVSQKYMIHIATRAKKKQTRYHIIWK